MNAYSLRQYQQHAVDSVYRFLRQHDGNPLVVLPVGSGKSLVIAQIVKDAVERWNGRVLMVTHVQELVAQNADKIRRLCPDLPVGVYCSALKRRDAGHAVVCASIQSIYKRAEEMGPRDLILIDEAHTCPPDGDGMYRKFLKKVNEIAPHARVIGLTATPYRLTSGPICRPSGLFQEICCEVGLGRLVDEGFLSPLVSRAGKAEVDLSNAPLRGGEFVPEAVEKLMNPQHVVEAACAEIVERTADRNACLIFAAGIDHGRHMVRVLKEKHGIEAGFVDGETPADERASILARFKGEATGLFDGTPLKYVVNYGVLTTGFDCPRLDAIAVLRATQSPGLLVQMLGRGTRLHPGKRECIVLDYGGNILRHGPIDAIEAPSPKPARTGGFVPAKMCPTCRRLVAPSVRECPDCGYAFPAAPLPEHDAKAADADVMGTKATKKKHAVLETTYCVHVKRGAPAHYPRTLRVDYDVGEGESFSEWICLEHQGYARERAAAWWLKRSPDPVPSTVDRAMEVIDGGGLATTKSITVRVTPGEKYPRIVGYELGDLPEACEAGADAADDLSDCPF